MMWGVLASIKETMFMSTNEFIKFDKKYWYIYICIYIYYTWYNTVCWTIRYQHQSEECPLAPDPM